MAWSLQALDRAGRVDSGLLLLPEPCVRSPRA